MNSATTKSFFILGLQPGTVTRYVSSVRAPSVSGGALRSGSRYSIFSAFLFPAILIFNYNRYSAKRCTNSGVKSRTGIPHVYFAHSNRPNLFVIVV